MQVNSIGPETASPQSAAVATTTTETASASVSAGAVSGSTGGVDTFEASWQFESSVYSLSEVDLGSGIGGIAIDAQLLELIIGLMLLDYLLGDGDGGGMSSLLELAVLGSILGGEEGAAEASLDGSASPASSGDAAAPADPGASGTLDVMA